MRLLTVAIPTFNRARLLDRQLAWLAGAVQGFESECEIVLSDNCSTDETPEVIRKWQPAFDRTVLHLNRHPSNVGAIRNIASCMRAARTAYVWTVSDDDILDPDALGYTIRALREHPELALLVLNFSSRHFASGKILFERCFEVEEETVRSDGKAVFERYLAHPNPARWGGLALTTALVYRTDLAQAALQSWPEGLDNLTVQLYVTAYCALRGPVLVTREAHLECTAGTHFFTGDDRMFLRFRYAEIAEAFLKLIDAGCSPELCAMKVMAQSREFRWKFVARCLKRWPAETAAVLGRYLLAVLRAQARLGLRNRSRFEVAVPPAPEVAS